MLRGQTHPIRGHRDTTVQVTTVRDGNAIGLGFAGVLAGLATLYGSRSPGVTLWLLPSGTVATLGIFVYMAVSWRAGTVYIEKDHLRYRSDCKWHEVDRASVSDVIVREGHFRSFLVTSQRVGLELYDGNTVWLKSLDVQPRGSRWRDKSQLDRQERCVDDIRVWLYST